MLIYIPMHTYDFEVLTSSGEKWPLSQFKGTKLLVVNVASKCGYTKQYEGLQELYKKYQGKHFEILAFPCNQFGGQEPGTDQEIQAFCTGTFGVTFPVLKKIDVNGDHAHPFWKYLKESLPGILGSEGIKWNFTKFLIDETGKPLTRFAPGDSPLDIEKVISNLPSKTQEAQK